MSLETVPRPRERERERRHLLSSSDVPDCPSCPSDLEEVLDCLSGTTREIPTNSGLIRTQPQSSILAPESREGEASKVLKGHPESLSIVVTNTSADARRKPSPMSHKVQRKLQSSLSISGHSSGMVKSNKDISKSNRRNGSTPDDCCVHCILACLFCQFLSMCNLLLVQLSCDHCSPGAHACCHCCYCCTDDQGEDGGCACDPECGVMESSDFLEICMECCGICFPS